MKVEALISTMNQKDYSILEKMNIQTDAIVINQCDHFDYKSFSFRDHNIRFYAFSERGVGLSRNSSMMRANGDICLFSDDDLVYVDGYEEMLVHAFCDYPKADIIVFNIESIDNKKKRFMLSKPTKIGFGNYMRYGTARIAVRIEKIREKNISFSLLFGGGAKYGSGEDTLFLHDCIKSGLKIMGLPITLAKVDDSESSWFHGYTQKYYMDKGVLFFALYGKKAWIYCIRFALMHKSVRNESFSRRWCVLKWLLYGFQRRKSRGDSGV